MLTASKSVKCKACGGKGAVQTKDGKKRRCFACRGSGKSPGYQTK